MRILLSVILMITGFACTTQKPGKSLIIFDTDIAPDYDDVGALAMLHAFADKGETKILATISCNAFETTVPTLSVINTYFNRIDVPIGVVKKRTPNQSCDRLWAQGIIAKYPHALQSGEQAMDAVKLYRKILVAQADSSVTIVTVGFFTNLADLLDSKADEYSALTGAELVAKKVKQLVSMAGSVDSSGNSGYEFNVMADIPASQKVFADWPTPITLSGLEIGREIFTGMRLINDGSIQNSPVKDAYQIAIAHDGVSNGRYSWDQTAVLIAVRGIEPYFNSRKLNFAIKDDGKDTIIGGSKITYIIKNQDPKAIEKVIEDLMMHEPVKR